jgi:teichuronic acid biosynthesis glycosyltransferase TuaG
MESISINPLVSIITPLYNSGRFIDATINSVISQSYTNWELIIVDDCSTDNSYQIVKQRAETESKIKLYKLNENSGHPSIVRNYAIEKSKGDFIAFLDSDDLWDELKLEKQVNFMVENNFCFSHTAYRKINSEGVVISKRINVSSKVSYKQLLKHNEIGCLTAMYNAQIVGKHLFPNIGHEDFAAWLKILKAGYLSHGLNTVLASYRVHSNTVSSNKIKAATYTWHIFRKQEKLSIFSSLYHFSFYIVNALWKYLKR